MTLFKKWSDTLQIGRKYIECTQKSSNFVYECVSFLLLPLQNTTNLAI